jgi:hypothetical protein
MAADFGLPLYTFAFGEDNLSVGTFHSYHSTVLLLMSDHGEYAVGAMLIETMLTDTFAYVFIKQGDWHAPVRGLVERPFTLRT